MWYAFFVFADTLAVMQNDLFPQELTVGELTKLIKTTLEGAFYGLKVSGEISNFRPASSGHWFFALKDKDAVINAVMFKASLWKVGFHPKDGDKVTVTGSLDVYPPRGTYQIICDTMEMTGNGEILAMLEERKRKFDALGYFANEHKVPLPLYPKRVGVVTSPTGAALQDILQILGRRAPALDVLILPAVVQGDDAAPSIAQRIREANLLGLCDVLIVGRGGGSIEDLLPFSEECVIKEIYDSVIPIVSAVGHEIDWALSDYAADLRAPTPSAAAELVSKGYADLRSSIKGMATTLDQTVRMKLENAEASLLYVNSRHLTQALENQVASKRYLLANTSDDLEHAMALSISARRQSLEQGKGNLISVSPVSRLLAQTTTAKHALDLLEAAMRTNLASLGHTIDLAKSQLSSLNPLAILERGYSVTTDSNGNIIKHAADLSAGQVVGLRFQDGKRTAVVEDNHGIRN